MHNHLLELVPLDRYPLLYIGFLSYKLSQVLTGNVLYCGMLITYSMLYLRQSSFIVVTLITNLSLEPPYIILFLGF